MTTLLVLRQSYADLLSVRASATNYGGIAIKIINVFFQGTTFINICQMLSPFFKPHHIQRLQKFIVHLDNIDTGDNQW